MYYIIHIILICIIYIIYLYHTIHNKAAVAVFILEQVDFMRENITKDEEKHFKK